jgi:3-phytase
MKYLVAFLITFFSLIGCSSSSNSTLTPTNLATPSPASNQLSASYETDPVPNKGDAADDPAIWRDPRDPSKSLIIGSDKLGGLAVYDLKGKQLAYHADGAFNNVDLRQDLPYGEGLRTIVAASEQHTGTIVFYTLDEQKRSLQRLESNPIAVKQIYGLCLYQSKINDQLYAFATTQRGRVEQWAINLNANRRIRGKLVRSFEVGSQAEGCVVDDNNAWLYIAEEDVAIWRYAAEPDAGEERTAIDRVGPEGQLTADIEGLTLYENPDGTGYLIASNQGASSFSVYLRQEPHSYLGHFEVEASDTIDAVSDTDGIAALAGSLGPDFPAGIIVVQDGDNRPDNQNFKLIDWRLIAQKLGF